MRSTFASFLDAAKHLYKRVCPSVRPYVRPYYLAHKYKDTSQYNFFSTILRYSSGLKQPNIVNVVIGCPEKASIACHRHRKLLELCLRDTFSNLQSTFFMSFKSSLLVAAFSWLLASESFHCVSHIIEVQLTYLSFNVIIGSIQSHQFYLKKIMNHIIQMNHYPTCLKFCYF